MSDITERAEEIARLDTAYIDAQDKQRVEMEKIRRRTQEAVDVIAYQLTHLLRADFIRFYKWRVEQLENFPRKFREGVIGIYDSADPSTFSLTDYDSDGSSLIGDDWEGYYVFSDLLNKFYPPVSVPKEYFINPDRWFDTIKNSGW